MSRASESSNLSSSLRAASSYLVSRCNVTLGLEGRFSDLPRDFKSLVSRAPDCDSGCLKGHGFESRPVAMPQGFVTPRGSYPQNPVKNPNNPRINGTAYPPSQPYAYWAAASSPVFTSITNNPIVKNKVGISCAYEVDNL